MVGLGAGVVWSLGALCARSAKGTSAWQYLTWRSIAIIAVIEGAAVLQRRPSPMRKAYTSDRLMLGGIVSLLFASLGFVYAVKNTSAANAAFLGSMSPMIAAVLGWLVLKERLSLVTIGAIALSLVGLIVMVNGETEGSNVRGNIGALSSAVGFACYTLCLRRDRSRDWAPVMPGYAALMIVLCSTVTLWQGDTLVPAATDIAWAVFHGGVLITVGTLLYNAASRVIAAVTMTIFAQTEMVFVPVWVFLKFNESPKVSALVGGGLILFAVIVQAVFGRRTSAGQSAIVPATSPTTS